MSHAWLMRFLEHRIGDRRMLRLIGKWLKAGILEEGRLLTLIDALLRRLSPLREESQRAAESELPSDTITPRGRGLGAPRRPATPSRRPPPMAG
jgi:hypothetical protein